jgi:hypothetical protein
VINIGAVIDMDRNGILIREAKQEDCEQIINLIQVFSFFKDIYVIE